MLGMSYRLEHALAPSVTFLVMPIFALANAGVEITSLEYLNIFHMSPDIGSVGMGVFFGLLVGKPLGIFLASWGAVKSGLAELPEGATWRMLFAVGCLGGIGFTMSLFVDALAYTEPDLIDRGKIAILMGSTAAAVLGSLLILIVADRVVRQKTDSMNMDRRLWIFPALALLLAGACSKKTGGGVKLKTDTDSVAYVIGMNVGMNLMKMDSTINVNAVCEGIRDVFRQGTKFSAADAEVFYLRYMNYALPEKARAYEEQFLQDILKANRNYARTASGVTYTVEVLGDQEQIPASDRDSIALRYLIRTADGRQLYSSYERGDTLRDALGSLRRGVREGVKLIGRRKDQRVDSLLGGLRYGGRQRAGNSAEYHAVLRNRACRCR